jgi:hypothetical protein
MYLIKFSTISADDHQVVPDLPVVVVTLDGLLKDLPGPSLLTELDVRVGKVVPSLKVLQIKS